MAKRYIDILWHKTQSKETHLTGSAGLPLKAQTQPLLGRIRCWQGRPNQLSHSYKYALWPICDTEDLAQVTSASSLQGLDCSVRLESLWSVLLTNLCIYNTVQY